MIRNTEKNLGKTHEYLTMLKHDKARTMDVLYLIDFSTGSGNGLVPSGNKPLPEPMLKLKWESYLVNYEHL